MPTLLDPSVMVDGCSSNGPSIISGALSNTKKTYSIIHCIANLIMHVKVFAILKENRV